MAKNEVAVVNVEKIEKAVKNISAVCAKVEQSTEEYKKCISDLMYLKKEKAHADSGMTFHDFIHEKTGMGRTTCTYLLRIGKYMEDSNMDAKTKAAFTKLPMRTILSAISVDKKGEEMANSLEEIGTSVNPDRKPENEVKDIAKKIAEKDTAASDAAEHKEREYMAQNESPEIAFSRLVKYINENCGDWKEVTIAYTKNGLTITHK